MPYQLQSRVQSPPPPIPTPPPPVRSPSPPRQTPLMPVTMSATPGQSLQILQVPTDTPTISFRADLEAIQPDICTICMDRQRNAILLPCFHPFCSVCATHFEVNNSVCPICRTKIGKMCFVDC
ncbi:RING finger protein 44-like [Ruditapes philippinarum]|uniref:RING finger protein 44-like n=1 Tax=Ruditapes philippinarum TaxID=129788 RepID=UPI00295BF86F|nr:RING finger protein 44-like [Ruditapes philippinarum]